MSFVNGTLDDLVFHCPEEDIPKLAMRSFRKVGARLLEVHNVPAGQVMDVNTKQKAGAVFAKMLALWDEAGTGSVLLNAGYLRTALHCVLNPSVVQDEEWQVITGHLLPRRSTYQGALLQAFSFAFLDMHLQRVLTLPWHYTWPHGVCLELENNTSVILQPDELPSLFQVIRSVYDEANPLFHGFGFNQRSRAISVATKMLTALGWQAIEDANYEDLAVLYRMGRTEGVVTIRPKYVLELLENAYGKDLAISSKEWSRRQDTILQEERLTEHKALVAGASGPTGAAKEDQPLATDDPFVASLAWKPGAFHPDKLTDALTSVLGAFRFEVWRTLENAFIRWAKYENDRGVLNALGYLNLYLTFYLPVWYQRHPDFKVPYPSSPNLLVSSIFVSDIGLLVKEERPLTFVVWVSKVGEHHGRDSYWAYAILKQCETFFAYLARNSDELPECSRFKQPLSKEDYPRIARSSGTNKRPIPRRIFALYLRYMETLIQYYEHLLELCVNGAIDDTALGRLFNKRLTVDTYEAAGHVGYVPVVSYGGAFYPIRNIPNCVEIDRYPLQSGETRRIPELNALYQVYVALHTGLRHQHIQWLDARTFDKEVEGELGEYARLWVNTDKAKSHGWAPVVSKEVILTLRKQAAWRAMIDLPAFQKPVYYEDNPNSKWGLILPLFSVKDGYPHPDRRYATTWEAILLAVHIFLLDMGEDHQLARLMHKSVSKDLTGQEYFAQAEAHSSKNAVLGGQSILTIKSYITPHSARVSVVSHLTAFLPADIVGKYITGQTAATVHYYTVADSEELLFESISQKRKLRTGFYEQSAFDGSTSERPQVRSPYIKADAVNSALSDAMRADVDAAVVSFGCVSLSVSDIEENGIDVLKRTRYAGAAENKTEICPYGNNCPADILKLTKGHRRCAVCPYAVRSVDHLPAVSAKGRQVLEKLEEIEVILDSEDLDERYSGNEIDELHDERGLLAQEVTAWRLAEEVLEQTRQKLMSGEGNTKWVVGKPEIIERHLKAVAFPTEGTERVLARLAECIEFPMLESPTIRAQFDLLRRQILANRGNVREALLSKTPANPAFECAGLLRSVMDRYQLSVSDIVRLIDTDNHLEGAGSAPLMLSDGATNGW